jgi:hypothetical protein
MRGDGKAGERRDVQGHGEAGCRVRRSGVQLEQARADERSEREGEGGERRPAAPIRAPKQQEGADHADRYVEPPRSGNGGRQRQPEHRADAENDQRRLEPELPAESLAAGAGEESCGRPCNAADEGELHEVRRGL